MNTCELRACRRDIFRYRLLSERRALAGMPEESADFSASDVFDLAEFELQRRLRVALERKEVARLRRKRQRQQRALERIARAVREEEGRQGKRSRLSEGVIAPAREGPQREAESSVAA